MIEPSSETRRIGGGIRGRAGIALLVALAVACGREREAPLGGVVVLQTAGWGYVELGGGYWGGCRHACDLTLQPGESVTLTPRPESCFRFLRWTGSCAGQGVCTLSRGGETTAVFTTEPSGGEWSIPASLPPQSPPPFDVPGYAITEITNSPDGLFFPRALDDDGNVLGDVMNCGIRPARYDAATGTHSILAPFPDADSAAIAAASDGTVLIAEIGAARSFRWKERVLERISIGRLRTVATAMNAAGRVVGWGDVPGWGRWEQHAFVDDGTETKDLGEGWASAVNDAGEVVLVDWEGAALFGPPTIQLPIPRRAVPFAVSNTGIVVAGAGKDVYEGLAPAAFVYDLRTETLTPVSPLPGDTAVSLSTVNRSGTLAVGRSWNPDASRSVIWKDGRLLEMSSYLGMSSSPTDLVVTHVNDRGQFLFTIEKSYRYYVLTPR